MRNLLNFIIRFSSWVLFAFYVTVSCMLLFSRNPFHHSLYLTSANSVSSAVYRGAANVSSYFGLRSINEDLQIRITDLEMENLRLRSMLRSYEESVYADTCRVDSSLQRYSFIVAHVINNSTNRPHNYITIEKGSTDGIEPGMGVVDQNGVVGIVNVVGEHSARVISLLNSDLQVSCKVKGSAQVGTLVWDGLNSETAVLQELPRHAEFNTGDTIVTSGHSMTFPEGVPVGVVTEMMKDYDGNFHALRVKLFTDFSKLSTVRVVSDYLKDELLDLQRQTEKE